MLNKQEINALNSIKLGRKAVVMSLKGKGDWSEQRFADVFDLDEASFFSTTFCQAIARHPRGSEKRQLARKKLEEAYSLLTSVAMREIAAHLMIPIPGEKKNSATATTTTVPPQNGEFQSVLPASPKPREVTVIDPYDEFSQRTKRTRRSASR